MDSGSTPGCGSRQEKKIEAIPIATFLRVKIGSNLVIQRYRKSEDDQVRKDVCQ